MATLEDAEQLRSIWDPEHLGQYEGMWIAFRKGQVVAKDSNLDSLSSGFAQEIETGDAPLFAFVTFVATV